MTRAHSPLGYTLVLLALIALLALSVVLAHVNLGPLNTFVALFIASAKATLVMMFFMHLLRSGKSCTLAVVVGVFMLAIACTLAMTDYAARDHSDPPRRGAPLHTSRFWPLPKRNEYRHVIANSQHCAQACRQLAPGPRS